MKIEEASQREIDLVKKASDVKEELGSEVSKRNKMEQELTALHAIEIKTKDDLI